MKDEEIDQLFLDENELMNLQFQAVQETIKEDDIFFYNLFNSPVDMLSHAF
jgi:hypothetical protein